MSSILRTFLVFIFVVSLSVSYLSNVLWACGACEEGNGHSSHEASEHTVQTKTEGAGEKAAAVKDPVCGMNVGDIKKAPSEEYKGKVYYFCSEHCKKTFKKDPASHIPAESPQHGEGEGHKH